MIFRLRHKGFYFGEKSLTFIIISKLLKKAAYRIAIRYSKALKNQVFWSGSKPERFQNWSLLVISEDFEIAKM